MHFCRLRKIREKVKSFKIKGWYKLYLLTKKECFWKWYCGEDDGCGGGIGRKVDTTRQIKSLSSM